MLVNGMKCLICGGTQFRCIHKGTRDISSIDVMKCEECGMVQLNCDTYNTEDNYERGGMLKEAYSAETDRTDDMSWETWIAETEADDERRYRSLKDTCIGKSVLEFGCGNGGFLRRIQNVALDVEGIELMDEARENLAGEGIQTYKSLNDTDRQYDVVCMFMVIEHLNDPDKILGKIYKALKPEGLLICETPNADDALISWYECEAFKNFTYWSEHVKLFTSVTLEKLLLRNGCKTELNTQIQRYPLSNHLYWLAKGKPGGHVKWKEFNEEEINEGYAEILIRQGIADTLWYIGKKS